MYQIFMNSNDFFFISFRFFFLHSRKYKEIKTKYFNEKS